MTENGSVRRKNVSGFGAVPPDVYLEKQFDVLGRFVD